MKVITNGNEISPSTARPLARAIIGAGLLFSVLNTQAAINPPDDYYGPTNVPLNSWSFYDYTNWTSDYGYAPVSFTNLDFSYLGNFHSLVMDTNIPAWLQYNVFENDGNTNLVLQNGSVAFWFAPGSWSSTNLGGTGPGEWGRLLEVGDYREDSSRGWWSIFVDPAGANLYFAGQTNDLSSNLTVYVSSPISWTTNFFHQIIVTYSATNTALFLDGAWVTNGPGVTVYPGLDVLTNGFWIGASSNGLNPVHGLYNTLQTYDYPLNSNDVQALYEWYYPNYMLSPLNTAMYSSSDLSSYGTNLSLSPVTVSGNLANLFVVNSGADVLYEIQSTTNLANPNWITQGFVDGSELTNFTTAHVMIAKTGAIFLRIRSWIDTTGTGIPDWWWLKYFGQTTNVDAYASSAGDAYNNLYKFQNDLNPTNYYDPAAPGGFFGAINETNAYLYWNPVTNAVNYLVQRGVQDTNGNYVYTQFLLSSNATWFEDIGVISNANAQNNLYTMQAVFPGGSSSGTNTWKVYWYSQYGTYGPPYAPPMPGNVWANADATGTNVVFSWTLASSIATNYQVFCGVYNSTNYAYNYSFATNAGPTTTNLMFIGALANDWQWADAYKIQAVYPGGGLSVPVNTLDGSPYTPVNIGASTNGPAAPGNFFGYVDGTGTNVYLNWNSVAGAVTNYLLYGLTYNSSTDHYVYRRLAVLGAAANSYEVVGAEDGFGNDAYLEYAVAAVFTNGSLSQSAAWSPGTGAPAPGTLNAWLDESGTNVQLSWTAAAGSPTGYLIQRSDYGVDYPWTFFEVGQVGNSTTSLEDTDAVDTGYFDPRIPSMKCRPCMLTAAYRQQLQPV